MSVKFFINTQTIGKLGAAAVGYATADRLGLNRAAVATVLIFSATIGSWSGQAIQAFAAAKYLEEPNKRMLVYSVFSSITLISIAKTAQIVTEKLGVPLSFIQCIGVSSFYNVVVAMPLGAIIGSLFPSISIYK